jgi:ABC-type uncharacterized transport system involved in gliding motility auxiliary subunit
MLKKIPVPQFIRNIHPDKPLIITMSMAVFVLLNLLAAGISLRGDFSKGKAYTLSPATKKIIRNLDDVVTIKFYASSDLPVRLSPVKRSVEDFLNEYKKEGGSKIVVKVLDPKKDAEVLQEVEELQIPELQFSQLEKDKYQISSSYFALGIFYGSQKNVLPQATDLPNLEYNITSFIYKLTKKELDRVAVAGLTDPSAAQNNDPYSPLRNTLATQFLVSYVNLSSDSPDKLDDSIKTLLLIATNDSIFSQEGIAEIKKYMDTKGKVIVLTDGVRVSDDLTVAPSDNPVLTLLNERGIRIRNNLILSASAEFANFGNELYQYYSPYPFWIKTPNLNRQTGYFSNISSLTFPWSSSVIPDAKLKTEVLAYSPDVSWEQKDTFELYPQKIPEPKENDIARFPLVVSATTATGGRLIVIPSSRFLDARYLSQNSGNIEFVYNALNNLASGGALAGIRSRSLSFYQLPDVPANEKETLKYLAMGLLPLLYGVYGGVRLIRRK